MIMVVGGGVPETGFAGRVLCGVSTGFCSMLIALSVASLAYSKLNIKKYVFSGYL